MVLRQLQGMLERIYDVPLAHDVVQFVLTDRGALPEECRASRSDEQLLVADDGAELALGLFLDPAVLARLDAANPLETLNGDNLADYWTALEGVSHFVYLAWNAAHDRPVSLLELELQAEVDKYVSSVQLLRAQDPTRYPVELHRVLFERARVSSRPGWRPHRPLPLRQSVRGALLRSSGARARARGRTGAVARCSGVAAFLSPDQCHEDAAHRMPGLGKAPHRSGGARRRSASGLLQLRHLSLDADPF